MLRTCKRMIEYDRDDVKSEKFSEKFIDCGRKKVMTPGHGVCTGIKGGQGLGASYLS